MLEEYPFVFLAWFGQLANEIGKVEGKGVFPVGRNRNDTCGHVQFACFLVPFRNVDSSGCVIFCYPLVGMAFLTRLSLPCNGVRGLGSKCVEGLPLVDNGLVSRGVYLINTAGAATLSIDEEHKVPILADGAFELAVHGHLGVKMAVVASQHGFGMARSAGQAVAVNAVMFPGELGTIMAVLASGIDTISIKH